MESVLLRRPCPIRPPASQPVLHRVLQNWCYNKQLARQTYHLPKGHYEPGLAITIVDKRFP